MKEMKLINGEVVKMNITFAGLMKIRKEQPEVYKEFIQILQGKEFDPVMDTMNLIYVGYLCANKDANYSKDDFLNMIPFDLEVINTMASELMQVITGKKEVDK